MCKKKIFLVLLIFIITSCESVKRGLTGEKSKSKDEFFIKKKDPLILPPNYESLPLPGNETNTSKKISSFEKSLGDLIDDNSTESSSDSTENSILKKIQSK